MTNEEFAFDYAGKEFIHYGNRAALAGPDSENPYAVPAPPAEIRTEGTPADPGPVTIGELIREHGGMKPVSMGDGLENVSSEI